MTGGLDARPGVAQLSDRVTGATEVVMDIQGFADPWEHLRLLADTRRNAALRELLVRRAPGARVLEVGCGTGVFACLAARLGAERVVAVEPTPLADVARELAAVNGLSDRVIVHEAMLDELDPEPMDLVFSELLNADPFMEDIAGVACDAARWLAPGGHLAPGRLDLWAAPTVAAESAEEVDRATAELGALGLDVGPVLEALGTPEPYRSVAEAVPLGPGIRVLSLQLGAQDAPESWEAELPVPAPGRIGGVTVWFEAALDRGLVLTNRPGTPNHWGQLVCGWSHRVLCGPGPLRVRFTAGEDGLEVVPI
ncbi:MAG: SAM-dependent methyltransferase [Myxococcota bacterium]|jgi:SAM-dependent methyltransferase